MRGWNHFSLFLLLLCGAIRYLHGFSLVPPSKFSWYQQWYPVAVKDHLIEDEPTLIHLLNKNIVVWKGKEEWHAFDEACPHRLASLSFAQVDHDQDQLMCRYHGQRFDGNGRLVFNPMAPSSSSSSSSSSCSKIMNEGNPSRKGNVQSYPTMLAYGLLWVWPSDDTTGIETLTPLMPPEMVVGNGTDNEFTSIYKEWPLDWIGMVENNLDPSHAQFTHEGSFSYQSEVKPCISSNARQTITTTFHTHPLNTPFERTLSIHTFNTPSTLSTHPLPCQHTLNTPPIKGCPPYQHTHHIDTYSLSTHPPYQHTSYQRMPVE